MLARVSNKGRQERMEVTRYCVFGEIGLSQKAANDGMGKARKGRAAGRRWATGAGSANSAVACFERGKRELLGAQALLNARRGAPERRCKPLDEETLPAFLQGLGL